MATESRHDPGRRGSPETTAVFALYDSHHEADQAIRDLQTSGCDMQQLSVIGRGYYTEQGMVGSYTSGDQTKAWGTTGAFWGSLWSVLVGSAFFLVPGIGPLFVAGPVAGRIVAELEDAAAVGQLNALGAALCRFGVPQASIREYETEIRTGKFVLIAHGSLEGVQEVKAQLTASGCHGLSEYSGRASAVR